jgi:Tfp pilus assembly protein PilO
MLAKKIIIATVTVLFLIAFARWGTEFVQGRVIDSAKSEKTELTKRINVANKAIAAIPQPDEQLMTKLAQLEMALKNENIAIPSSMDSTLVINSILELATSSNVTAVPLETTDWASSGEHYKVYTLQVKVMGDYEQIATFIDRLENGLFETLIITSLEISGGLKTDIDPDTATVQVAVYTRN